MPAFEAAISGVAKTISTAAATHWLSHRRATDARSRQLSDLIAANFRDRFVRRKVSLQIDSLAADIAERINSAFGAEYATLSRSESVASLNLVKDTFRLLDHRDEALFQADMDPIKVVASLKGTLASEASKVALSDAGLRLAEHVLTDSIRCYLELVRHLPEFAGRAHQENFSRLSRISADVGEILNRLPVHRPSFGSTDDDSFTATYLDTLSTRYDQLEILGVDVRNYTPDTTLSIAYLSLTVTSGEADRAKALLPNNAKYPFGRTTFRRLHLTDEQLDANVLRVDHALAQQRRVLIRGEAGSGKSTLLRWLTITACRRKFTGNLAEWNNLVPFVVKLRQYADKSLPSIGQHLTEDTREMASTMPSGWVERMFENERALLLIDGVDELISSQRGAVRLWVRKILQRYPNLSVVVTSRPTAASARWLVNDGFSALMLERMSPTDIIRFVQRWHRAIVGVAHLPCDVADLPRYERRLLARFDSNHHLRGLATNPLMCAMLCALNLDRADDLPHDRISLYKAALEMLIERRDSVRNVPAYRRTSLATKQVMSLLQDLAWRLSISNRSELDAESAKEHVRRKLETVPNVTDTAEDIFTHLLDRSGVLKDVAEDRISFVHRTFQEFLTANEVAEENYIDVLVTNAARDIWRETVIMTAGIATSEYRERLIRGILVAAQTANGRNSRWLKLLAGACVETAPALKPNVLAMIDETLQTLVPPRSIVEARSLALAGERVVRFLPDEPSTLTPAAAAAVVKTAAFIGGPRALDKIAAYGTDQRPPVIEALMSSVDFFEPEEYAKRVLANSPLDRGLITVDDWTVSMLPHLKRLTGVIAFNDAADLGEHLPRHISSLDLYRSRSSELAYLPSLANMEMFAAHCMLPLSSIPDSWIRLKSLAVNDFNFDQVPTNLEKVKNFPELRSLNILQAVGIVGAETLKLLPKLSDLCISQATDSPKFLPHVRFIEDLPELSTLRLNGCSDPALLDYVSKHQRKLSALQMMRYESPNLDLSKIPAGLKSLDVDGYNQTLDLAPLAHHPNLRSLDIRNCKNVINSEALAAIPNLANLYAQEAIVDLQPLRGVSTVTVYVSFDAAELAALGINIHL